MSQTDTLDYAVSGMHCNSCAMTVREEVAEVPGVGAADVELASGRLTVSGVDVSDAAVRAAVADAGYEVDS